MRRVLVLLGLLLALAGPASALSSHRVAILGSNVCANVVARLDFAANAPQGIYCLNGQRYSSFLAIPGATLTRASVGTAMDSAGRVLSFASGQPRITDLGLLIEESRTNIQTYSQDLSHWAPSNATTASGQVAPDGMLTAWDLSNTPNSTSYMTAPASTLANSTTYTRTIYAKAVSGTNLLVLEYDLGSTGVNRVIFNVSNGGISLNPDGTSATIRQLGSTGWFKCTHTFTTSATGTPRADTYHVGAYGPTATATTVRVWQADLTVGAFDTSPILTTSVAVTRAADVARVTSISGAVTAFSSSRLAAGDGTAKDFVALGIGVNDNYDLARTVGNKVNTFSIAGGVSQYSLNSSASFQIGSFVRTGITIHGGVYQGAVNGVLQGASASGKIQPANGTLFLGSWVTGAPTLNDYLQRLALYGSAFSDSQLLALTQ